MEVKAFIANIEVLERELKETRDMLSAAVITMRRMEGAGGAFVDGMIRDYMEEYRRFSRERASKEETA